MIAATATATATAELEQLEIERRRIKSMIGDLYYKQDMSRLQSLVKRLELLECRIKRYDKK